MERPIPNISLTVMKTKRYTIQVRKQDGSIVETIKRVLYAEQIGNFNPYFCRYKNDDRCLVKSDAGDLSDPFRRTEEYAKTFYIVV